MLNFFYITLQYRNTQVRIYPLVLLQSSLGSPIYNTELLTEFNVLDGRRSGVVPHGSGDLGDPN